MDTKATKQKNGLTGLSKRQQVERSNKAIFIWVAVAATVVALALVAAQFLIKEGLFNNKIISQKTKTNKILVQNIADADVLKKNMDTLLADESLQSVKTTQNTSGGNNFKVILDALPTTGDKTAFANALYTNIITPSGMTSEGLSVGDEAATAAVATPTTTVAPDATVTLPQTLPFAFNVTGNVDQTKTFLTTMERVIRPLNVAQLVIKADRGTLTTSITGNTYYLPASKVQLGKVTIKP